MIERIDMAESVRKSSPALVAVAWLVVLAPTLWGLTFSVQNALKLFRKPPAAAAPVPSAAAPATH
jgi:hypothetical protein